MADFDNKTCARLEVQEELHDLTVRKTLFVKSVREPAISSPTSFSLAISDGHQGWTFEGDFPLFTCLALLMKYLIVRMFLLRL